MSGVGKSTHIKTNILKNKKNYIYFPIGGVITRKNIINRLKKIKIKDKSTIHLDLYDTDNIDLMMEFLFGILITRLYKVNEEIISFPKNTDIYIEIPNDFICFKYKFPILDLIPQNKEDILSINNLGKLIVDEELDSNVQIVSNYLKLLKENNINKYRLIIPKITQIELMRDNRMKCNAVFIPSEKCQELILELFKKK